MPFWLRLISIFSLSELTVLATVRMCSSFRLAWPPIRVMLAGPTPASRSGSSKWKGTFSRSLHTRPLPATHGPIGSCRGNDRFISLTNDRQCRTIIDTPSCRTHDCSARLRYFAIKRRTHSTFTCIQTPVPMNRVQFQSGFLTAVWNRNAMCGSGRTSELACRHQTSLIAGTLFQSTRLLLTLWFLAIILISQAKTGLSSLTLERDLGGSYPAACPGGERTGGKAGRGSENMYPYVAAVSLDDRGHPLHIKLTVVPGFTRKAISDWGNTKHRSGLLSVLSDGLSCFTGVVTEAGCHHQAPWSLAESPGGCRISCGSTACLCNLKTSLSGACHAFDFAKYAPRYLAAFAYRFNRRFHFKSLPMHLLAVAFGTGPWEPKLRLTEQSCVRHEGV